MVTVLKELERKRKRYPWHSWTDGTPRRAKRRKDFFCTVAGFQGSLYNTARRKGLSVQVTVDGDFVSFQFAKPKGKSASK